MSLIKTIHGNGLAIKEFKKSRFIGNAFPVANETEAKRFVEDIRQRYPDANHNVFAYRITGDGNLVMKYDDDGEPTGSSGKPVFKVLEMKELNNVVVIITRYFGGIKLGFGGLSRAYKKTAIEAIDDAGIVEQRPTKEMKIIVDYGNIQFVKHLLENCATILDEHYSDIVEIVVAVAEDKIDELEKLINEKIPNTKITRL
ncbi:IMPACT family protein [Methanohalophilus portucalensis]|uniref:Uncharacterized protein, YigZ family n=2 Tax=Methanohalophilus portucalensis TaxID=39664 RepID=A0A1L9C7G3_9EURY|nr:YigZ family protein [Methanohalophilus portucalensis]ATU08996.1 YigZ family protein [Methanohalophilus portucalensis]OJH50414.1 hypothetical protein MPF_0202 [Methanohalophilus portucalensis FDF-1]RNI11158.1 YigZ family protein [Methanohalophilus portucalensis FDF-1]SMH29608.1 uncharacterized protein, YigZ family [Methanohalophilus portucalensis FDF-1]